MQMAFRMCSTTSKFAVLLCPMATAIHLKKMNRPRSMPAKWTDPTPINCRSTMRSSTSSDHTARVVREDYRGGLGRDADTGELSFWTNFLNTGGTAARLAQDLSGSAAFQT